VEKSRVISKGKLFWKKEWYSICSRHYIYNRNCNLCQTGSWRNVWVAWFDGWFYKKFKFYVPKSIWIR